MSVDQRIKGLCDSAAKGSSDALVDLLDAVKLCEEESQLDRPLQLWKSNLHPKHFPPDNAPLTWVNISIRLSNAACSIDGLSSTKMYFSKWPSVEDSIIDAWPGIIRWLTYFHRHSTQLSKPFVETLRILTVNVLVSFATTERLSLILRSSDDIFSILLPLWSAEARNKKPRVISVHMNTAVYALSLHFEKLHVSETHKIVKAHGGNESSAARTALQHLQYDMAQSPLSSDHLQSDIALLGMFSAHVPLRDALLLQGSLVVICNLLHQVSLSDVSLPEIRRVHMVATCCQYLRTYLESNHGIPNVIKSLEADMLVSLLRSHTLLLQFPYGELPLSITILTTILPRYLVYRRVVILVNRSIQTIAASGVEVSMQPSGLLWDAWIALKELTARRLNDIKADKESLASSCGNTECTFPRATTSKDLKKCASCQRVFHCSRYCQRTAWPAHKETCQMQERSHGRDESPHARAEFWFVRAIAVNDILDGIDEIVGTIRRESMSTAVVKLDYSPVDQFPAELEDVQKTMKNLIVVCMTVADGEYTKAWHCFLDLDLYSPYVHDALLGRLEA